MKTKKETLPDRVNNLIKCPFVGSLLPLTCESGICEEVVIKYKSFHEFTSLDK